ncbi:MAG: hypothetical protein E7158_00210 [Firmicutes bacterium]|nr:hypothetical protein [Bacillota bacterium]
MKLIKNYLSMYLKILFEYKANFIISFISQMFSLFLELYTVFCLFNKFSFFKVYNRYELLLGFSIIWFGMSFAEQFGRGFDHFDNLIRKGNFDLLLIRPRNIYLQIFGSDMSYEKSGRVIVASFIFIYSLTKVITSFNILKLLLIFNVVIASVIIYMSLFIASASFCFITVEGLEFVNIFTNGSKQVGQYPMGIYNKTIRRIFTFIIPICLVNYYPLKYLNGSTNSIYYVFMPLLCFIMLFISILIFNFSMKKYCSTGS